ncbi:MAG: hypothetical protein H0T51_04450 [Pirellulales bacterium]|nr:hypothetical protein [Pirellulales bacterium]
MSAIRIARRARRGISFVEFLGCFIAVAGGVVLGSMYLGVDVQETAITLLERAEVIEKPETPGAAPATALAVNSVASATNPAAPPSTSDWSHKRPVQTGAQAAAAQPAVESPVTPAPPAPPAQVSLTDAISFTHEQRAELTRAYWEALNERMKAEVAHRANRIAADGEWELYDYLTCRSDGHKTAAEAIDLMSLRGVDGHVTAYAKKVQAWHESGAILFARAKDLLTDAPTAQMSGPFAQSWQSAATQHQMEERLLKEKHQAVQSYLDHAGK